jgi:hypothetical protein
VDRPQLVVEAGCGCPLIVSRPRNHRTDTPAKRLKICLAINYNFVIMPAFYEKDALLFCNCAVVDLPDLLRRSVVFCL